MDEDEISEVQHFVTPGDIITEDAGFMRGHGTYLNENKLFASVAGVVERVNKLVSVKPLKTKYTGEVGDVVVGRITEVVQKRWKVDTFSKLDSVLLLSAVNLPGGELRRRSAEDELVMREYLSEGDLIFAEVQSLYADGSLSLHTRSLKYGKLPQGTLIKVSPSLIKRCKIHVHDLPCGATVILGNNGYIWIGPVMSQESDLSLHSSERIEKEISKRDREVIARLRNCISCLAESKVLLYDTSILYAYEASLKFPVKELLRSDVQDELVDETRANLLQQI
ncbi:exosome complex component RRP4-like [Rhopilema esculentum]|uniref:exosome complex component RRP4-like n=1 Tax=Rhopilema esculentum TaxID=499914 RepID=UPI0031D5C368